jgi:DNA polymerase-3 subunit epsilon
MRQAQLVLAQASIAGRVAGEPIIVRVRPMPLVPVLSVEERAAHRAFLAELGESAIWLDYISLG